MSVYITGDVHGELDIQKLSIKNWPESRSLTREDVLIITGDFGLPFLTSDVLKYSNSMNWSAIKSNKTYHYWMKWLSERPYTILFVDGNHECFPFWSKQPVRDMFEGKVQQHVDADNVFHLMRGEYYTIQGQTFWTMGGADSPDKHWRTEGVSWWRDELPSVKEMNHGLESLEKHDWKVDYIVTHTMPQSLINPVLGEWYDADSAQKYLDVVLERTNFKGWFCGHFHRDLVYAGDYNTVSVCYNVIKKII